MKKNRILSSLLCLSLAAGLLIPGLPAYAEGEGESGSSSGMKLSKTAVANGDGTYTITLEAYATGEKVISQVDKYVPTDIVLVLDQSGSMEQSMNSVNYTAYDDKTNSEHYKNRHNGGGNNLHYWDESTGAYYEVSVNLTEIQTYKELGSLKNYSRREECYWDYVGNLYEKVGEEYKPVALTYDYVWDGRQIVKRYSYTFSDETIITSDGDNEKPNFGSHAPLYTMTVDESQTIYTYTYKDAEGNIQTIGTSTGASTEFDITLFKKGTDTSKSRLEALKTAVTTFADSVAKKAAGADGQLGTEDDINHRVAVVGFASQSGYGNNTELLSIAGSNSGSVGIAYNSINNDPNNLKKVLQDMRTTDGRSMVTKAINALAAEGATEIDLGMDMAQRILAANPVPSGEKRNRVVVVFTDGSPTTSNGFEMAVANRAITKANTIKADGAKVYAVGIFGGADPTTAGKSNGTTTEKSNWFMQNLSSNNGTVSIPGFYLSASDSTTLNSIFEKLAGNIESGGTTTTLNESAVIKDIISPQFTLPAGATASDITLETYEYKGPAYDAANAWTKNATAMGATAEVDGDKVNVTGFNFSENWCGTENNNGTTTYRGNKLVISFTVSPKAGFLGGNNVYTNTSAGVYENKDAPSPVLEFEKPQVNVLIKDVTVDATDKDVYLLTDVALDALKNGATVDVGGVSLDLSKAGDADKPFGLDKWQTEYVDITVEIKDKDGKVISADLSALKDDTTYTITVTVAPKTDGTGADGKVATEQSGSKKANINVYKPELTYKDSEVFYGDDVPTDFDKNNRTETVWKHGDDVADTKKMGAAPDLAITYTPNASQISDGKINSTQDIPVAAVVKIGNEDVTTYTTFVHTPCAEGVTCGWSETTLDGDPAFLLHVKTASLIINKTGADGNKNEGFIFNVTGPNNLTLRVSVQGNGSVTITGLPLGTYTVTEDEGWSWRYTATGSAKAELTKAKPDGAVTIQNEKDNPYLLDGNDYKQNNFALLSAGN